MLAALAVRLLGLCPMVIIGMTFAALSGKAYSLKAKIEETRKVSAAEQTTHVAMHHQRAPSYTTGDTFWYSR
jgi:hypothetical protein